MAPIKPPWSPLKRPSSSSFVDPFSSPTKTQRRTYTHHHSLHHNYSQTQLAFPDQATVDRLLQRSISLVLDFDGFEVADPVALESFRDEVEEYILHFSSLLRQSMTACRRTQVIPQDVDYALREHGISLPSLLPHLQPPVSVSQSQSILPSPPPDLESSSTVSFFGLENDAASTPFIPGHFPGLPSKHSYMSTPVFTKREEDPRKVRESATEEGRLGEAALRKLAGAVKGAGFGSSSMGKKVDRGRRHVSMERMFEKTVQAMLQNEQKPTKNDRHESMEIDLEGPSSSTSQAQKQPSEAAKFEFGPIVNYDMGFWRKGTNASGGRARHKSIVESNKDTAMTRV